MIGNKYEVEQFLEEDTIYNCKEIKESRSQAQNRLYHQWVGNLAKVFKDQWTFITPNDLHECLRDTLLEGQEKINILTWEVRQVKKSTVKLTKKEFTQYIKDIEHYLWQARGVSHPLPTDMGYSQ